MINYINKFLIQNITNNPKVYIIVQKTFMHYPKVICYIKINLKKVKLAAVSTTV